ncbi:phage/plasmid primase, P4 family [Candidatus Bathyarchaeota archaeon]|nr:phage/plasmid primase, P4 family [Candidatus Bathyarchaeota archaeon]
MQTVNSSPSSEEPISGKELKILRSIKKLAENTKPKESRIKPPEIADRILQKDKYHTEQGITYIFDRNEGTYVEAELKIREKCSKILGKNSSKHIMQEILYDIIHKTSNPKLPELPKNLIPLQNGLFDIETKTLLPFNENYFITSKLPITYNSEADCPLFKKFLSEVLNAEDIPTTQEWFGYHLQRDNRYEKTLMALGVGDNGKSVFLKVLKAFLGSENVSNVSLQDLAIDRFATSSLHRKLANIFPDINSQTLNNTGIFKALTSGDPIEGQRKFGQRFSFTNHAKLSFSANTLPMTLDDSNAFFKRWLIVRFPNSFPVGSDKRDTKLIQKLTTSKELSGILNWALEGLERLNKKARFSDAKTTEQLRKQYTKISDPIQIFCNEKLEDDIDGEIPKTELYKLYVAYCRENNLQPKTLNIFAKNLHRCMPNVYSKRRNDESRGQSFFGGVSLKTKEKESELPKNQKTLLSQENSQEETYKIGSCRVSKVT